MPGPEYESLVAARIRRWLDVIIWLSLIWFVCRVSVVKSREGDLPFQSANDRSRWCTVRALVDQGTYRIDDVIQDRGWNTIDKVAHPGRDNKLHYYSSKPTLFPTLLAGMYWVWKQLTGIGLADRPMLVVRVLVGTVNGALLATLLFSLKHVVLRYAATSFGAVLVVATAAWGTYLTSFAVTINNHLVAAAAIMLTVASYLRAEDTGDRRPGNYLSCGFWSAFAVTNELPALSWLGVLLLRLAWRDGARTVKYFVPAAAVVFGLATWTNWQAHRSVVPPYAHRQPGGDWQSGNWYVYPKSYWLPENRKGVDRGEPSIARYAWHVVAGHHGIVSLTPIWLLLPWGFPGRGDSRGQRGLWWMSLVVTVVCLVFYIVLRPLGDRNYSGMASAFRWSFWLIPLWLVILVRAADRVAASRAAQCLAWLLWLVSAVSAAYAWWLPWQHPWIYAWWYEAKP